MKNKSSMGLLKIAAALLALIAGASGCQQPTQVAAKSPTPVRVADVALHSSSESLRYSASVLPFAEAALSFKTSGYVTGIKQVMGADGRRREVGPGDYITRGALLAQIRHQDLKNQLDQAAAAVTQAEAQHLQASLDNERAKALYSTHSLTKPEFDQSQARFDSSRGALDQAKASLRQAQLALADADLSAPFSGFILARNIELGNLASPGTVAFTIADIRAVKVSFGVPEYAVKQLRLGQEFNIHLQDDPKEYKGRVTSIAAGADEKNRVFAIEVTVPNPKNYLKPGMIASLNLAGLEKAPTPSVPLAAVVAAPDAPGRYCVFVASEANGKWTSHLRAVTLGETHDSDIAVEGVKPGEKIVVVGVADLKDGDLVQVLQ
jgi:RND family efflux transporter MFP subunit